MELVVSRYHSPAGELLIGSHGDKICLCDWVTSRRRYPLYMKICRSLNAKFREGSSEINRKAMSELDEYFSKKRCEFTVETEFCGTDFQREVWNELKRIPYGSTISYAELSCRIGKPKAVRAVANANALNPISIFVPCHRVIGCNNKLTGYGGGLEAKRILLATEGVILNL